MRYTDKHIILIGFKHVGKSVLGKLLALRLHKTHIDLDHAIEQLYQREYQDKLNCREITRQRGEDFFRQLEHQALRQVIQNAPCVISLGGGAVILEENRELIQSHCVIHITAPPKQVFERIMRKGRPAFFPENENPWITFNRLWREREKVYKNLAVFSVRNDGPIGSVVERLLKKFEIE